MRLRFENIFRIRLMNAKFFHIVVKEFKQIGERLVTIIHSEQLPDAVGD